MFLNLGTQRKLHLGIPPFFKSTDKQDSDDSMYRVVMVKFTPTLLDTPQEVGTQSMKMQM